MNSQPTFGEEHEPEDHRGRDRHENEDDQRIGRKHGDAPILVVAEAHLVVGEELVVIERVALVDRAQALDVDRPVHDELVHRPFEQVGEQEGERDREPFQPRDVMDVLEVDVERRRAHGVDDHDVEIAVIPSEDAGAVFLPKIDLPLTDHCCSPCRRLTKDTPDQPSCGPWVPSCDPWVPALVASGPRGPHFTRPGHGQFRVPDERWRWPRAKIRDPTARCLIYHRSIRPGSAVQSSAGVAIPRSSSSASADDPVTTERGMLHGFASICRAWILDAPPEAGHDIGEGHAGPGLPSMTRRTAASWRAACGLPAKMISPRSMT